MNSVLGIGNALVDVVIRLKDNAILDQYSLPKGSMQLVEEKLAAGIENASKELGMKLTSGGSSANTIHGLAKLGIRTGFIGKAGTDTHGEFFRKDMQQAGIEARVPSGGAPTGRAITLVSPDSERTFATFLGSAIELNKEDLDHSFIRNFSLFHIEGYLVQNHELVEAAFRLARELNLKSSLDLASYNVVDANKKFLKDIVTQYVDYLFANEEEARTFTGKSPDLAVQEIAGMCDIAIVKTGKNGSLIQQGNKKYVVGAIDADCIDTTGAGDLYASGFLYGLIRGLPLDKCGALGSLLAGKVIEVLGAKMPPETWEEISARKEIIEKGF